MTHMMQFLNKLVQYFKANFSVSLILTILVLTGLKTYEYKNEIFAESNRVALGQTYGQSQYVLGDNALQKIDDSTLYSYAADAYFKGEDPTTINFEHPPLGKYVFGLSLWLFNRVLVLNVVWFGLALGLFAVLLRQLKFSNAWIFLAITYLALGSSLANHLKTALLDTQILIWSLGFFVALFWQKETWLKYSLVGLALGGLISTKYLFPIAGLYLGLLAIWAYFQRSWFKAALAVGFAGTIYLLSYTAYFYHQHSLVDFLKFEWFRFKWWTDNRTIPKFIWLQTVIWGKFPMWWESTKKYQIDGDWNLSWPILFLGYLLSLAKQKISPQALIILTYSVGLLFIYLVGSAVYGRYILQLIPFWLIIIGWAIQNVQKLFHKS